MKHWRNLGRRGFALFLAMVMCVSLLQLTALAADETSEPIAVAEHVHHTEGWICTPYCSIPEHTHSDSCYWEDHDEEAAQTPVTLPGEILIEDGSSTEKDDFGNEYAPPEFGTAGEDGEFKPGLSDSESGEISDKDDGTAALPEGPEDGGTAALPEGPEDGGNAALPEGPEDGGNAALPEGTEDGGTAALPEGTEDGGIAAPPEGPKEDGEKEIPEEDPPLTSGPMLMCGMEEHVHTDACAEKPDGGWHCVPDTNITINVAEQEFVIGSVDLLEGVTASPAYCGNWPVHIAIASVTLEDGTDLELEDGQWLNLEGGVTYTVEYVAYVDTVMALSEDGETDVNIPEGILAQETMTLEVEAAEGTARIGSNWYQSLQAAVDAAKNGDTIELFADVKENIASTNKSYTLDMQEHTITGTGTTHVFTIKNPNGGTVTLKNGTITGGKAVVGGGIFACGIKMSNTSLVLNVENCTITGNTATGGYGGGVSLGYTNETSVTNATSYSNGTVVSGVWKDVQVVGNTGNGVHILGGNTYKGGGTVISPYGDLQFENVTISNNTTSLGSKSGAAGLNIGNTTFTMKDSQVSDNVGGSAGGVYINGYGVVNLGSGVVIKNNKGTSNASFEKMTGGLSWVGSNVTIDGAVIKNNSTSSGNYAGVYLKGLKYHSFNMVSGAIYENGTSDSNLDVYVTTGKSVKAVNIIAAKEMADPEVYNDYFAEYGYVWRKGSGTNTANVDTMLSHGANSTYSYKAVVTTTPPAVAKIGETEYITLEEAVKTAGTEDTIVLAVTEEKNSINSSKDANTIEVGKAVTFDLANGSFKAAAADLFDLKDGGNLTLTGGGTLQGNILVNGGSLTLDGKTNLSDANSVTFNSGTVTLSGEHEILNVSLARGKCLTASEDFTGKLSITLDEATLKELNGTALRDDVVLLKGLTAEAAAAIAADVTVKGLEKDSNTAVAVNEAGDIVLRKSDNPGVYLGGVLGSDENSGRSSKTPVATFEKALEIANTCGFNQIFIVGAVSVAGDESWDTGNKVTLMRYPSYTGALVVVSGGLTLSNIVIDGGGKISERDEFHNTIEGQVTAAQGMVQVNGGNLVIGDGAVLQNNLFHNVSALANGGAVTNNNGSVCLVGGEVRYNSSIYGGGIYSEGTLEIQSGSIHHNTAIGSGASGGGVVIVGGQAVMSGGEVYQNKAHGVNASGGGISVGNVNDLLVHGDPTFEMSGGTVSNNISYGVGGGISAYRGTTTITKGDIIGNSAKGNRDYAMEPDAAFAGGGLYIQRGAVGILSNVEVTGNGIIDSLKDWYAYAISCCYYSDVTIHVNDGMIIHGNDNDTVYIAGQPLGVLFDPDSVYGPEISISRYTLGGGLYNWEKGGISLSYDDLNRTVSPSTGSFSGKPHVSAEDVQRAQGAVQVRIADNTAGGKYGYSGTGIGCNGSMVIGSGAQDFELSKTVVGKENDDSEYTFQIALSRTDGASIYGESKVNNSEIDGEMGVGTVYGVLKHADESSEKVQMPLVPMEVNGKTVEGVLVGLKDGDSIVLTDLPYGTLYTVVETNSNGAAVKWNLPGEKVQTGASASGEITTVYTKVTCVNDYTANLKITKEVDGGPDSASTTKEYKFIVTAPDADENGTYPVVDNNNAASTVTFVNGKAVITITGSGSKTISGLKAGEYKVVEDAESAAIKDYNWTHTVDKDPVDVKAGATTEVTIKNVYRTPNPELVSLSVTKVWNDEGNASARPSSIVVALRNSSGIQAYVTLSDENGWYYEWTDLSPEETWTVDEVGVPGYTSVKTQDGSAVTITNTPETPPPSDNPPPPSNPPRNPPGTPPVVTEIPDPNVPGAPEEVTVIDDDVPLTYVKTWDPEEEEYVYVPEEEVPLADMTPETGDSAAAAMWSALCLTSAAGLAVLRLTAPRKKEETE